MLCAGSFPSISKAPCGEPRPFWARLLSHTSPFLYTSKRRGEKSSQKGDKVVTKKRHTRKSVSQMLAPPIFPGRHQPGIVGRNELNYRVRNGNGWTLALIGTNLLVADFVSLAPGSAESSLSPSLLALLGKRFAGLPRRKGRTSMSSGKSRKTNWIINFSSSLVKRKW